MIASINEDNDVFSNNFLGNPISNIFRCILYRECANILVYFSSCACQIVSAAEFIEGFYIYFRQLLDPHKQHQQQHYNQNEMSSDGGNGGNGGSGGGGGNSASISNGYQMLTVLNAGASTFQIVGLEKFTTYQIFLLPFYKNVDGRPSNYVNVTTLQDGK